MAVRSRLDELSATRLDRYNVLNMIRKTMQFSPDGEVYFDLDGKAEISRSYQSAGNVLSGAVRVAGNSILLGVGSSDGSLVADLVAGDHIRVEQGDNYVQGTVDSNTETNDDYHSIVISAASSNGTLADSATTTVAITPRTLPRLIRARFSLDGINWIYLLTGGLTEDEILQLILAAIRNTIQFSADGEVYYDLEGKTYISRSYQSAGNILSGVVRVDGNSILLGVGNTDGTLVADLVSGDHIRVEQDDNYVQGTVDSNTETSNDYHTIVISAASSDGTLADSTTTTTTVIITPDTLPTFDRIQFRLEEDDDWIEVIIGQLNSVINSQSMPSAKEVQDLLDTGREIIWIVTEDQISGQNRAEVTFQAVREGILDQAGNNLPTTATPSNTIRLAAGTMVHIQSATAFRIINVGGGDNLPDTVTRTEAEAGTVTELRSWTPERVSQAIAALADRQPRLSRYQVTTDVRGRAQVDVTLGSVPGIHTIQAVAPPDLNPTILQCRIATFRATAIDITIHKISGDAQSGFTRTILSNPFVAQVCDQNGDPIANVTVDFAVTGGGGTVSDATDTTGSDGRVQTTLTLGSAAGANTVRATVRGISTANVDFTATAVARAATSIHLISGNNQSGDPREALSNPFVVEVRDQLGDPVAGVTVNFAVTAGGGTISDATDTTDSDGRAETTLTLGSAAGENTVRATVSGISTNIDFTANTDSVATSIHKISGDDQTQTIANVLDSPFVVEVRDQNGNAMSGVTVNFAIRSGDELVSDGSVSDATDTTDTNGRAETTLTLGSTAGENIVRATISGANVDFTATGEDAIASSIHKISGDMQSRLIGTELANPFVVEVRDQNDNTMSGVTVNFAVTAGGGTISDATDTTDSDGRAETTLTLGSTVGANTVRATVSGINTNIDFTATGQTAIATSIHKISGDMQSRLIGTELANPFVVEVRDQNGDPLAGVTVNFAVMVGGGTISDATDTTDSDGRAETTLTLGSAAGANTVRATVSGIDTNIDFTATGQGAMATSIHIISGDMQESEQGFTNRTPLVVEVRNQLNQPMAGVNVDWAVASGDGLIFEENERTTTGSNGRTRQTEVIIQDILEEYTTTITATIAGTTVSVTFTITATVAT